ncbi:MAG: sugar transferase [Faecousia sp.]
MIYQKYIKRLLDILISLIALPFVAVVILITGVAIVVDDGFPVFYNANRIGKDRKEFKMFKLRSMKNNAPDLRMADGSTYNAPDDPRLTKVGRFLRKASIDELPQVINVLLGQMSFIGPRPDLPDEALLYNEAEWHRLDVRPGITGYSQAYFRNSIPTKEKYKNDLYYVQNMSFALDMKILLHTIKTVAGSEGVYAQETDVDVSKLEDRVGAEK